MTIVIMLPSTVTHNTSETLSCITIILGTSLHVFLFTYVNATRKSVIAIYATVYHSDVKRDDCAFIRSFFIVILSKMDVEEPAATGSSDDGLVDRMMELCAVLKNTSQSGKCDRNGESALFQLSLMHREVFGKLRAVCASSLSCACHGRPKRRQPRRSQSWRRFI